MDDTKRIIEINGVKIEVDLRTAKVIDQYRVGDSIKLLRKRYSDWEVCPAVILAFTEFKKLPTLELLYIANTSDVQFIAFNAESKDMEIAPFNQYEMNFQKEDVINRLESDINSKRESLRVAEEKLKAFNELFGKIFKEV
jgi:hypothetical protein